MSIPPFKKEFTVLAITREDLISILKERETPPTEEQEKKILSLTDAQMEKVADIMTSMLIDEETMMVSWHDALETLALDLSTH